jgi:hypothetical protein
MKIKKTKTVPVPPVPTISRTDKDLLAEAYKSGLISGWKIDPEHGYRLTLANQHDEYVEVAKLTTRLEALRRDPR